MFRRLIPLALLAVIALVSVSIASGRTEAVPTLKGTVGPGFTITLKRNGRRVKSLKHGRYRFVISDKSSIHGFTIEQEKGGKFEKLLSPISFVGRKTVTVKLKTGKWKFYCPNHESEMFGFFTVK